MKWEKLLKVIGTIIIIVLLFGIYNINYNNSQTTNKYLYTKKMDFKYLTYKDISTSIDERNRLVIINYINNTVTILSDTVTLGIHAQISTYIYKDFIKTKNK